MVGIPRGVKGCPMVGI